MEAVTLSPLATGINTGDTLEFHLVDGERMAEVNEEFLQHEGPTDVITFSYIDEDEPFVEPERTIGEIFVCPQVAEQAAAGFGQTVNEEVVLYLIHGILHLSGLDDHEECDIVEMRKAEQELMEALKQTHDLEQLFELND